MQYALWNIAEPLYLLIPQDSIAWCEVASAANLEFSVHITLHHDDIPPPRPYGPWPRPPPREAAVEKPLPRSPLREKFMGRDAASDAGEPAA